MVKTLASIFISLALIVGISAYDIYTVGIAVLLSIS